MAMNMSNEIRIGDAVVIDKLTLLEWSKKIDMELQRLLPILDEVGILTDASGLYWKVFYPGILSPDEETCWSINGFYIKLAENSDENILPKDISD